MVESAFVVLFAIIAVDAFAAGRFFAVTLAVACLASSALYARDSWRKWRSAPAPVERPEQQQVHQEG